MAKTTTKKRETNKKYTYKYIFVIIVIFFYFSMGPSNNNKFPSTLLSELLETNNNSKIKKSNTVKKKRKKYSQIIFKNQNIETLQYELLQNRPNSINDDNHHDNDILPMSSSSSNNINILNDSNEASPKSFILTNRKATQSPTYSILSDKSSERLFHDETPDMISKSISETWYCIGSFANTLGEPNKALNAYNTSIQYNPRFTDAIMALGNLYFSRDMFNFAIKYYQRALDINDKIIEAWLSKAQSYLLMNDLSKAFEAYQDALQHLDDPNIPKLWHGIGVLYAKFGTIEYAKKAFERVINIDPKYDKVNEVYFRLGIIYKYEKNWSDSIYCFQKIITCPPIPLDDTDIWFQLGCTYGSLGDLNQAKESFEKSINGKPKYSKALQQLGHLYDIQESIFYNPNIAVEYLLKAIDINSEDCVTWYLLGRAQMDCGDTLGSIETYQKAINIEPMESIFWCSLGNSYYQIGKLEDTLEAYLKCIRLNPYISEVWYNLGVLYEITCENQIQKAIDAYLKAYNLDSRNIHIFKRLSKLTDKEEKNGESDKWENVDDIINIEDQSSEEEEEKKKNKETRSSSNDDNDMVLLEPSLKTSKIMINDYICCEPNTIKITEHINE